MLSLIRPRSLSMTIVSILLWVPLVCAQQELNKQPTARKSGVHTTAAGPVPPAITNAKKVFISNLGMDLVALDLFRRSGEPDLPYNQFYAMVKDWGRYELVSAPGDADLVFEIRAAVPERSGAILQLELTIRDTKTHFVLWNLVESVDGALRRAGFEKNLNRAMNILADDLKKLTALPPAASASSN